MKIIKNNRAARTVFLEDLGCHANMSPHVNEYSHPCHAATPHLSVSMHACARARPSSHAPPARVGGIGGGACVAGYL